MLKVYRNGQAADSRQARVAGDSVRTTDDVLVDRPLHSPGVGGHTIWREIPSTGRRSQLGATRALILLGGSVRRNELAASIGRSVLDLPVKQHCTVLDIWRRQALRFAGILQSNVFDVRVLASAGTALPKVQPGDAEIKLRAERDPFDLRGTGGVLRDVCAEYHDDDFVLVATATQILNEPLADLATELASKDGDVAILAHEDGSPSSLMFVRCGALRSIPEAGFVDMKEQALPLISKAHKVVVVKRVKSTGLPIRTLEEFCRAVHILNRGAVGDTAYDAPFSERWKAAGHVIEDGATVHPSAILHDSVVLAGGRVDKDALVVHSIICPGGEVRRGQQVTNTIVSAANS